MSNVKLAVRLRPFTERELKSEKERISVVNILDENTVSITNIKVSASGAGDSRERVRRYFADYTFDSACSVTHPAFASQEKVFETIGRKVVASVLQGATACVLAYGQSATGKTHTMMGSEAQPGLVPRLCRALAEEQPFDVTVRVLWILELSFLGPYLVTHIIIFSTKFHNFCMEPGIPMTTSDETYVTTGSVIKNKKVFSDKMSFLEIYNERVHDLLAGEAPVTCHSLPRRRGNALKDLRVREHPSRGPYVQNLRRVAVQDIETLLSLVSEGTRRRRTAATRRNSTSSRSHALLELTTPRATLYLADLAGSEKASWEGCGGGRQKEGANINKSLVALSNVISALVSGGGRGRFVPYRDSALTWLLKDCFTGGASTFIIATVSPSVSCYGESASTLRWAERARRLPTPRLPTCGPSTASRAALQAQFSQLLAELTRHHIRYMPDSGKISFDDNHWALHQNKDDSPLINASNTEGKIGNLINMLNPKTDVNNSDSTASSIASGSSDVINTMIKNVNIKDEISKEVDKLFGPALERTKSDLDVTAPLRHKRRQYKSQEVLPIDKIFQGSNNMKVTPSQSQDQINEIPSIEKAKTAHVPILYDNQRAEIVASVTERLYSKLKKKEEATVSKVESMVDRKIMEPLNELKICTNARQRLMELSQKAMRHKRRIGIPAHTQTRKSVTRVRDQGIDVQTDLLSYVMKKESNFTLHRDVGTDTIPMTPRYKEIAVGSQYGSLDFRDSSTITESKHVVRKNSFMMTDVVVKCDRCTQTPIVPPPRRKKRASSFPKQIECDDMSRVCTKDNAAAPFISINISQHYPVDSESQSSDDNLRIIDEINHKAYVAATTPDLLTNHNTVDTSVQKDDSSEKMNDAENTVHGDNCYLENEDKKTHLELQKNKDHEEFPDPEDCSLPRVTIDSSRVVSQEEIKNMILGRNELMFPYNVVFSPQRERENTKRIVKFLDLQGVPSLSVASQTSWEWENNVSSGKSNISSDVEQSDRDDDVSKDLQISTSSDSTLSSKVETDSFIWKKGGRDQHNLASVSLGTSYTPVYKSNSRYRTARSRIYKEFLGLEKVDREDSDRKYRPQFSSHENEISSSDRTEVEEESQYKFRQRRHFFEAKFNRDYNSLEQNVLKSCNSLEKSVHKYETSLAKHYDFDRKYFPSEASARTPTEYLQHLIQLRREVVKADYNTTDSSVEICHK